MDNQKNLKTACNIAVKKYLKANPPSFNSRNILRFTVLLKGALLFAFLFVLFCAIGSIASPSILKVFGIDLNSYVKLFRSISLSFYLHNLQPFHEVNTRGCLLLNPYHEQADPFCDVCENTKVVFDVSTLSSFPEILQRNAIPFVVKRNFSTPINLDKMEQFLYQNFGLQSYQFEGHSHSMLETNEYHLTRELTRIVPSPKHYLPKTCLESFHQYVFIDGSSSPLYSMPKPRVKHVFVMQAHGRRNIKLIPIQSCMSICEPVSIILKPGDILFYSWDLWNAISEPVSAIETAAELSIIKMGSFTLDFWERWLN